VRSVDGSAYPLILGWIMILLAAGGAFVGLAPMWLIELVLHPAPPRTRAGLDDD
jgi:hypothetical protein